MHVRRLLLAVSTAAVLVSGTVAMPALAGTAAPQDMIATPNVGPVGQVVTIHNAANSPCGGQQGDPPAQVDVSVLRPNEDVDELTVLTDDGTGDWSIEYTTTDLVGQYDVEATCVDQDIPSGAVARATDFDYTDTSFEIQAAEPTTTAAPTTTSTAAPAAAVGATAAFTG
jgi:hypothetical protein